MEFLCPETLIVILTTVCELTQSVGVDVWDLLSNRSLYKLWIRGSCTSTPSTHDCLGAVLLEGQVVRRKAWATCTFKLYDVDRVYQYSASDRLPVCNVEATARVHDHLTAPNRLERVSRCNCGGDSWRIRCHKCPSWAVSYSICGHGSASYPSLSGHSCTCNAGTSVECPAGASQTEREYCHLSTS